MWIITTRGMFSAVEHRDNQDLLMVRARSYGDLYDIVGGCDALIDAGVTHDLIIESKPGESDYRYRIVVPKSVWAATLVELTNEIDYDNFKNAVARKHSTGFAHILSRVWRELLEIERLPGAVKRSRPSKAKVPASR